MKSLLVTLILIVSAGAQASLPESYAVVANRGDSSLSLIDSARLQVVKTIDAQSVGFEFEPMYASHLRSAKVFVVGDRKGSKLLIFDDSTGKLLMIQPVSKGVFHQWAQPDDNEVVIATDGDLGADLIKIERNQDGTIALTKRHFSIPQNHAGSVPHDVVIDSDFFYLTAHATDSSGKQFDKVFKVNRGSLAVESVVEFSDDVHVGLPQDSPYLIVAEQEGIIHFLTRHNMQVVKQVTDVPGAHGLYWRSDASVIYSANIASFGENSLYVINNQQLGPANLVSTLDSASDKPHNLVADFDSQFVFLTHSGMNNIVSVYDISNGTQFLKTVVTGANPFGIGVVKR